jgi:mono/diheme cytochrome c family protein
MFVSMVVGCSSETAGTTQLAELPPPCNVGGSSASGAGGGAPLVSSAGAGGTTAFAGGTEAGGSGASGLGIVAGAAGSIVVSGASGGQAGGGGSGPAPSEGQALYDLTCKLCHAEQGVGSILGPELQHPLREYSRWVVRNGRAQTTFPKPMEKVGADVLSDAQLTLIWDYLSLMPEPTTGQALFGDYCANCHGKDAKGGPTQRNIINEVAKITDKVRNGSNVGQYQLRHDSMPVFPSSVIDDAELAAIHDYVDSL